MSSIKDTQKQLLSIDENAIHPGSLSSLLKIEVPY